MAAVDKDAAERVQDAVREEEEKVRAEDEAAALRGEEANDAGAGIAPGQGEPTGELVPVSDPRARSELDALARQVGTSEPSAQEIFAAITGAEELRAPSVEESRAAIVARILLAESPEEILNQGGPISTEEVLNLDLVVTGVRWMKSTFEEGPGVYAVIDATRADTEEKVKVTCGGTNVMTQLLKLQTGGYLPQRVRITEASKPTAQGYHPLWLTAV